MRLYIDGDALPNLLKPIILRTIDRVGIPAIVIANKKINIGTSKLIKYIIVEQGSDKADDLIVDMVKSGDLIITADIPLADRVISKQAHAIDHRGTLYSSENIKQYLAMRNLMEEIRDSGEMTRGPKPFNKKDVHAFANQLHAFVSN